MTGVEDLKNFDALLACVPVDDRAKTELCAMLGAPDRFYHGVSHPAQLWRTHSVYATAEGFLAPEVETLIACAVAYHDCVYDSRSRDNEELSAEIWMRASSGSLLRAANRLWVAETILATRDQLGYYFESAEGAVKRDLRPSAALLERARIWVLDLDLTPLGASAEDFDRDTASLRLEAAHLSDAEWEIGRLFFLQRFAEAPQIFRSPTLAAIFEAPARSNIARHLRRS